MRAGRVREHVDVQADGEIESYDTNRVAPPGSRVQHRDGGSGKDWAERDRRPVVSGCSPGTRGELGITDAVQPWWREHGELGRTQRFLNYLKDVLLQHVKGRIVVFIDEIDTIVGQDFTDDFFAVVRSISEARAASAGFESVSFVLIGSARPQDLIRTGSRTLYNIGHSIELTDFTRDEAAVLLKYLELPDESRSTILDAVLALTGGHPYLTLATFRRLRQRPPAEWSAEAVSQTVRDLFFSESGRKNSNLVYVSRMLTTALDSIAGGSKEKIDSNLGFGAGSWLSDSQNAVLARYRAIWSGKSIDDDDLDPVNSWLKLSGVVRAEGGRLIVRNKIYRDVFTDTWAKHQRKTNLPRLILQATALLIFVMLVSAMPLAIIATRQWRLAEKARATEEYQRQRAETARKDSERNTVRAREQEKVAEEQRARAEVASRVASALRAEAERGREQARSLSEQIRSILLASQAASAQDPDWSNLTVAVLVAIESSKRNPSWQSDSVLRKGLMYLPLPLARYRTESVGTHIALSPDSSRFARYTGKGVVGLWDAKTGKRLMQVEGADVFRGLDLSDCLAFGSRMEAVVYQKVGTQPVTIVEDSQPLGLAVRRDCGSVAVASRDQGISIYDLHTSGDRTVRIGLGRKFPLLKFDSSGERLAAVDTEGRFTLWDLKGGAKPQVVADHAMGGGISAVAIAPVGDMFAVGYLNGGVVAWNAEQEPEVIAKASVFAPVLAIAFSGNKRSLLIAHEDGLDIIALPGGAVRMHAGVIGTPTAAAFAADSTKVAIETREHILSVWDIRAESSLETFQMANGVEALAFTADGMNLAVSTDSETSVWSLTTRTTLETVGRWNCDELQLSTDGRYARCDESVYDLKSRLKILLGANASLVSFVPETSQAAYKIDTEFHLRDLPKSKDVQRVTLNGSAANVEAYFGRYLAVSGRGGLKFLDLATGRSVYETNFESGDVVAIGPRATAVIQGSAALRVCHLMQRRCDPIQDDRWLGADPGSFSTDGRYFALAKDSSVFVFDVLSAAREPWLTIEPASIPVWSPTGELGVWRDRAMVSVFNPTSKKELIRLFPDLPESFHGPVMRFSPDGKYLAFGADKNVQVFTCQEEAIVDQVCHRLTRNLSKAEWSQYLAPEPYADTCPGLPTGLDTRSSDAN